MKQFLVRFVLGSRKFDERGFLYHEEVSHVAPRELLRSLLHTQFYTLNGGYCFVHEGRIWNAVGDFTYDPAHVQCQVDDTNMALMLLDNVLNQFEDDKPVKTLLLESVTFEVQPQTGGMLRISGTTLTGDRLFPELDVPISDFFEQLQEATCSFVSFAQELVDVIPAELPPQAAGVAPALLRNLGLERWRAAFERLLEVRKRVQQEPRNWRR